MAVDAQRTVSQAGLSSDSDLASPSLLATGLVAIASVLIFAFAFAASPFGSRAGTPAPLSGHVRLTATHPVADTGFTFYVFSSAQQAGQFLEATLVSLPPGDYQIWLAPSREHDMALWAALTEVNGFRANLGLTQIHLVDLR
jgi:hypothetical protein